MLNPNLSPGGPLRYSEPVSVDGTSAKADSSLRIPGNVMPGSGVTVRDLVCELTGDATAVLSGITQVTVRGGTVPFIDCAPSTIRAWLGFMGKKAEWASTGTTFVIPLHGYRGWGAPPNQSLSLSLTKDATVKTPTLSVALGINDGEMQIPSQGMMYLMDTPDGLAATKSLQEFRISQPGILCGLVLQDLAHVQEIRYYDAAGMVWDFGSGAQLLAAQKQERGTTVDDPVYIKMPVERMVVDGVTKLVITTSGFTPGNIGIHTYIPAPTPAAK